MIIQFVDCKYFQGIDTLLIWLKIMRKIEIKSKRKLAFSTLRSVHPLQTKLTFLSARLIEYLIWKMIHTLERFKRNSLVLLFESLSTIDLRK